jgi:hypothetical protein
MTTGKNTFASTNDVLSANFDDLADLPSFGVPPPGAYVLSVTCGVKTINDKDAVEAEFTVVETVELADSSDKPPMVGDKFSVPFMLGNQYGVGNLKKFLAPFQATFNQSSIGALIEEIKGVTVTAVVKQRKDKNDPDKVYATVTNIQVA